MAPSYHSSYFNASAPKHAQEFANRGYEPPSSYVHKDEPTTDASSSSSIPVVDLHLIFSASAPAQERQQEIEKLTSALSSWGFFQAIGHGMLNSLLDDMRSLTKEFFSLPMNEKERYSIDKEVDAMQGYGHVPATSEEQKLDWSDRLYLLVTPQYQRKLKFWPEYPSRFRQALDQYSTKTTLLANNILKAIAKVVGLEEDAFRSQFGEEATMYARFNYYPYCSKPKLVYGIKPHSDGGGITILLPDKEVEGLQVLKDGEWVKVPIIPNALVINIGDQMEIMSNGMLKSAIHRVVPNSFKERISLAMFYSPCFDNEIGPADGLIDENRPRLFKKMKVKDYVKIFLEKFANGSRAIDSANL